VLLRLIYSPPSTSLLEVADSHLPFTPFSFTSCSSQERMRLGQLRRWRGRWEGGWPQLKRGVESSWPGCAGCRGRWRRRCKLGGSDRIISLLGRDEGIGIGMRVCVCMRVCVFIGVESSWPGCSGCRGRWRQRCKPGGSASRNRNRGRCEGMGMRLCVFLCCDLCVCCAVYYV